MFRLLLIATFFFTSALAQQSQKNEEPSLAEMARKERERRAGLDTPARIITNADLKEFKGRVSQSSAPPDAAADKKVEKTKEKPAPEVPKVENHDLANWQELFTSAQLKLELLTSEGKGLQQKMTELINGWVRVSDGQLEAPPDKQMQDAEKQINKNRQETEEAEQFVEELKTRARREGLPPGVIRELLDAHLE